MNVTFHYIVCTSRSSQSIRARKATICFLDHTRSTQVVVTTTLIALKQCSSGYPCQRWLISEKFSDWRLKHVPVHAD